MVLDRRDLYDPELVSRLVRWGVPGPPTAHPQRGIHRSPRRGASLEFSEHTEYAPGDDLRHLDWRIYAKTDRYYVKRYEDERLQRAVLVVDASGSMAYGGRPGEVRGSKYHAAARYAVALAACLLRQGDAVGLAFAGGRGGEGLPPRTGRAHLGALIDVLARAEPEGRAGLIRTCEALADRLGRAAAVFLFSDFLDPEDEALPGPRLLAARGIAARVVHVLHPDELDLPFDDVCRFKDLEGPGSIVVDPEGVRRAYREEIEGFRRRVAGAAEQLGAPYAGVVVGDDPVPALGGLLRRARERPWTS